MPPIYQVEAYETIKVVRRIEVDEEAETVTPELLKELCDQAVNEEEWEETESLGFDSFCVYRVDSDHEYKLVYDSAKGV